jgi:hypothetical protein
VLSALRPAQLFPLQTSCDNIANNGVTGNAAAGAGPSPTGASTTDVPRRPRLLPAADAQWLLAELIQQDAAMTERVERGNKAWFT